MVLNISKKRKKIPGCNHTNGWSFLSPPSPTHFQILPSLKSSWNHPKAFVKYFYLPFISSSISDLITPSTNLCAKRALCLDYSPTLRDICRSEKARAEVGRRTANNRGHYLRFLIAQNSFGNDYFNEQCEIFRQ